MVKILLSFIGLGLGLVSGERGEVMYNKSPLLDLNRGRAVESHRGFGSFFSILTDSFHLD